MKNWIYKKELYSNGQLESEGYIDAEVNKVGNWKYYDENGHLEKDGNYKEGLKDGNWKYFYTNGLLEKEVNF